MSSHSYDDTYWSAKCRKAALETPTQDLLTKLCAFAESFSVSSLFTIIRSHILCSTSGMQCRTSRLWATSWQLHFPRLSGYIMCFSFFVHHLNILWNWDFVASLFAESHLSPDLLLASFSRNKHGITSGKQAVSAVDRKQCRHRQKDVCRLAIFGCFCCIHVHWKLPRNVSACSQPSQQVPVYIFTRGSVSSLSNMWNASSDYKSMSKTETSAAIQLLVSMIWFLHPRQLLNMIRLQTTSSGRRYALAKDILTADSFTHGLAGLLHLLLRRILVFEPCGVDCELSALAPCFASKF